MYQEGTVEKNNFEEIRSHVRHKEVASPIFITWRGRYGLPDVGSLKTVLE
jgi:hypothetical protein